MEITSALEKYLISSFQNREEKKSRKFYLSDAGKCLKMRWLKRKGIEVSFEPYVYWTLQIGNILHDYGYKALESQGLLLEAEDYVQTEHFIGRYDGTIKDGKKKAVFDFKSAGAYKIKRVMAGEEDEEYIKQLLSYVILLRAEKKNISDAAYIVYLNKEPSNKLPLAFLQKEYYLTSWRQKQLQEDMDTLVSYWLKDKIPPCTCPGWMRDYNAYLPLCQMPESKVRKVLEYIKSGKKVITTNKALFLVKDGERKEVRI